MEDEMTPYVRRRLVRLEERARKLMRRVEALEAELAACEALLEGAIRLIREQRGDAPPRPDVR